MENKMNFAEFVLAVIGYDIKNIGRLSINCENCPLRAECRASAELEEYENESCAEFLERMLKVWALAQTFFSCSVACLRFSLAN